MIITEALVAHHGVLRQLFTQSLTDPAIYEEFVRHLIIHHTMEEKYFYDVFQEIAQVRGLALEAVNEHHIIELIIKDAQDFPREHERFTTKVEGLGEYTNHHLDEEELEVFPEAVNLMDQATLTTLGGLFEQAKNLLLGAVPPPLPAGMIEKARAIQAQPAAAGTEGSEPSPVKATAVGLGIGSLRK